MCLEQLRKTPNVSIKITEKHDQKFVHYFLNKGNVNEHTMSISRTRQSFL